MSVPEYFGSMVFGDAEMKSRLSENVYNRLKRTVEDGRSLDLTIANEVASAMKDWAVLRRLRSRLQGRDRRRRYRRLYR